MVSPFRPKNPNNSVKRNVFDLSFQNNLTMKFGNLYPVFCKEVIPGDSFRIKPTFGLRFMPMTFPIQTRMKAYMHFFYVRNRNLWKDFPDFIGGTKEDLRPPYIDFGASAPATGSLSDYLGLPTTLVGDYAQIGNKSVPLYVESIHFRQFPDIVSPNVADVTLNGRVLKAFNSVSMGDIISFGNQLVNINENNLSVDSLFVSESEETALSPMYIPTVMYAKTKAVDVYIQKKGDSFSLSDNSSEYNNAFAAAIMNVDNVVNQNGSNYFSFASINGVLLPPDVLGFKIARNASSQRISSCIPVDYSYSTISSVGFDDAQRAIWRNQCAKACGYSTYDSMPDGNYPVSLTLYIGSPLAVTGNVSGSTGLLSMYVRNTYGSVGDSFSLAAYREAIVQYMNVSSYVGSVNFHGYSGSGSEVTDITNSNSPYSRLKISALPYRAYESIYNSFYRDPRNNPYIINGQPEYNKWIPTQDGGSESIDDFQLRKRNWEEDFLTSAVQTPQQGVAPLVGLTNYSNGASMILSDDDGNVVDSASINQNEDGTFSVVSRGTTNETMRELIDYVSYGISINDFRNVNALQRWLEVNLRRGLTYKDQIKSHYGVDIRFDELDMPEFIGGTSQDVSVNQINQSVQRNDGSTFSDVLGSYAGQASCVGTGDSISHYCDEHGYIIGILSVVPVPNYSQLLPKHFLKADVLDYYFPEFGHIGLQPIRYNEVCPIQTNIVNPAGLDDVFGYQRAWYDYLASVDEIHGLFRTNLKNFVMNRTFNIKPELSESFLLVDDQQLNEVFSVTDTEDKILGQLYFDVKAKRPIPMYGIPRIEG